MADAKPKPDAPAGPAGAAPPNAAAETAPKKKRFGTVAIVAVVMVVEGVALFAVMKMMGGKPEHAAAAEAAEPVARPVLDDEEIQVVQLRALNVKSGRPVLYNLKVFVRVSADKADAIRKTFEKKRATIEDIIARIVRSAEPTHLSEDGLETLRRQIHFELGRICSEESGITEILIPECTPYPTGF